MNRRDRGDIKSEQRPRQRFANLVINAKDVVFGGCAGVFHSCIKACEFFELGPQARAKLASGLLGERDDENAFDRSGRSQQDLDDQVFESEGFARARRSLDHGRAVERDLPKHVGAGEEPDGHVRVFCWA